MSSHYIKQLHVIRKDHISVLFKHFTYRQPILPRQRGVCLEHFQILNNAVSRSCVVKCSLILDGHKT